MKNGLHVLLSAIVFGSLIAENNQSVKLPATKSQHPNNHVSVKPFTAKVVGSHVRVRSSPDMDSHIVYECKKGDLVIVDGEKNEFYAVIPPKDFKVYVFRTFVLDGAIEGHHVNVRLQPDLSSPIVGILNSGEKVQGKVSEKNHKWYEIAAPKSTHFFIAKEFLEKVGPVEIKENYDRRYETVTALMEKSLRFSESEMMKSFEEIAFDRVSQNFNAIINEYNDFPEYQEKAKLKLRDLQEIYLQKKLAYLEAKANKMAKEVSSYPITPAVDQGKTTPADHKKVWEKVEESLFLEWTMSHYQKTIDDFYEEQKNSCKKISGIIEPYADSIKNKPGEYILRDTSKDLPKAYLYSTFVDLSQYAGKSITLNVSERPNHNFAFPAYFVLSID